MIKVEKFSTPEQTGTCDNCGETKTVVPVDNMEKVAAAKNDAVKYICVDDCLDSVDRGANING